MVKGRSLSLGAWLVGVVALVVAAGQLLGPAASGAMAPMSQTYSGVRGMSGQMLLSGQAYAKHKVGDLTYHGMVTNAQRQAAAELLARQKLQALLNPLAPTRLAAPARGAGPLAVPDYFGGVRQLGQQPAGAVRPPAARGSPAPASASSSTRCRASTRPTTSASTLPIAVPDTTTYPGSDYYEIALRQYTEKMHSDLPADDAARLRADQQRHRPADAAEHGGAGAHPLPRARSSSPSATGRCASSSPTSCPPARPATSSSRSTRP